MGEERLELSHRERERLKVLHEVQRGHLTQKVGRCLDAHRVV